MAVRREILDTVEGDPGDPGVGGGFDPPPSAPPPAAPPPPANTPEVSGGATPPTDQNIQEFATEEGGLLTIAYGEHLVAGHLTTHKFVPGTPNQSTFVVALGDGWGNGGKHGEWEGIVEGYYAGEELAEAYTYRIWIEDELPAGSIAVPDTDGWNWIANDPKPYFGKYAHKSGLISGVHQHYFEQATDTLPIVAGDVLSCFVFLDATNPPQEIMLQFREGTSFEHRAYWGANLIAFGTNGTNSRRQISASVPTPGQWVRLDVPVADVGLVGTSLNGIAFTAYDGQLSWDQFAKWNSTGQPGFLFRRGIIPTDLQDLQHPGAVSLSAGLTHSGTADIIVILTSAQASEDRPDKFRGRFQCRRVYNWDSSGAQIGYGYSVNPANVVADRVLSYFEHIYPDDPTRAREKFQQRIDWPSWRAWADYNFATIPWNRDGSGDQQIPRFEAHIAFTERIILADALDRICSMAGAWWQDDGEKLIFLPPTDRSPIHHFNESNMLSAPTIIPRDLRERPNRFIARFRDYDDEFLGEVTVEVRREDLIRKVGEITTERNFSNMRQSQAQRLLERQARLECDNPISCTLVGDETSIHVLPGDFVTVSHPLINWEFVKCLVVDIELASAEQAVDEVAFLLQRIEGPLYSDTAHTPIQEQLTP
jgi:hypothetical protein